MENDLNLLPNKLAWFRQGWPSVVSRLFEKGMRHVELLVIRMPVEILLVLNLKFSSGS